MSVPASGIPQLAAGFCGNSIVIDTLDAKHMRVAGAPIFVQNSCIIRNNVGVPILFYLFIIIYFFFQNSMHSLFIADRIRLRGVVS